MQCKLENGITLLFEYRQSEIASICIGFKAGALEDDCKLGVAHCTEHMIYKGTIKRSEEEINERLSKLFAFQNAMTNYPYVIYYGSLLQKDLDKGIEIFSDLLINPSFLEEGFYEEMEIIKQELSEWDEDLEQYTEDKLFYNMFSGRLKTPIIGTYESLNNMTIKDIKEFYKKYYCPSNMVISVVGNSDIDVIKQIVNKYFGKWKVNKMINISEDVEKSDKKEYTDYKKGTSISRVEIVFPLKDLEIEDISSVIVFDEFFGKGVNSILFDILRTKMAAVYDVITKVSYESGIMLYKISFNTSEEKVSKARLEVINIIQNINIYLEKMDDKIISDLVNRIHLKTLFRDEQSIMLAKNLCIHNVMFDKKEAYRYIINGCSKVTKKSIKKATEKFINNYVLQKVTPM